VAALANDSYPSQVKQIIGTPIMAALIN